MLQKVGQPFQCAALLATQYAAVCRGRRARGEKVQEEVGTMLLMHRTFRCGGATA
jgi:hypothetical protein